MIAFVKKDIIQLGLEAHKQKIGSLISNVFRFFDKLKEKETEEDIVKYDVKWLTARLKWVETNLSLNLDAETYLFFEQERQLIKRQLLLYRKAIQPSKQKLKESRCFTISTG